jgi:hypothetical protein
MTNISPSVVEVTYTDATTSTIDIPTGPEGQPGQSYPTGSTTGVFFPGFSTGSDDSVLYTQVSRLRYPHTYYPSHFGMMGLHTSPEKTPDYSAIVIGYNQDTMFNSSVDKSVLIGVNAGRNTKNETVAIGTLACEESGIACVGIGSAAGRNAKNSSVSLGYYAGVDSGSSCVSVGPNAGRSIKDEAVAIGTNAGEVSGTACLSIGSAAGRNSQDMSVSLGYNAGIDSASSCVSVGPNAGIQAGYASVSAGFEAGRNASSDVVSIGRMSGRGKGPNAVCIGVDSGGGSNGNTVSVGISSGKNQEEYAVAVGPFAAATGTQGFCSLALGYTSGHAGLATGCIAVGAGAGSAIPPREYSTLVGYNCGLKNVGPQAVVMGFHTGMEGMGTGSIAIGAHAHAGGGNAAPDTGDLKPYVTAVGYEAVGLSGGECSIGIGFQAGKFDLANNAIVISALSTGLDNAVPSSCKIAPIRNVNGTVGTRLYYDSATSELTWGTETSARRYKTNIAAMDDEKALKVLDLVPCTFDMLEPKDVNAASFGLIAEDVAGVYPEMVVHNPATKDVEGVMYDKLVAPLIAVNKILMNKVLALEARLNN